MRRPGILIAALVLVAAAWWWKSPVPGPATTPVESPAANAGSTPIPAGSARPTKPSRDLSADEARGGHTLARHVGRTDDQLRERLQRETNISAASTYTDRAAAERTVAAALAANRDRVDAWLARSGNRPNLAIDYRGRADDVIGRSLMRGRAAPVPCIDAIVVLRWSGRDSFVLTSYPEARR